MQTYVTKTAQENLGELYDWHREYSESYAEQFHDEIVMYLLRTLPDNPKIGHVYNAAKRLYRLIYKRRYNVYYTIKGDAIYILFIIDGRMLFNSELAGPDIEIPDEP